MTRAPLSVALHAAAATVLVALTLQPAEVSAQAAAASSPAPAVSIERIPAEQAPADRTGMQWQLSSKFMINPDDPVASVPSSEEKNNAPMQFGYFLQDLSSEAAYADKALNFPKAAKYWAAVAKAVPDVAVGYRKACRSYQAAAEREKALEYCAGALTRAGVMIDDYIQHGELLLAKPGALAAGEISDIDQIVAHLRDSKEGQPDAGVAGERLACRLGAQLSDAKRLERCTLALQKSSKDDPNTLFFSWNLAMLRKNFGEAKALLEKMRKSSIAPGALRRAEEATAHASAWWRRPLQDWRYSAGLGALLLAGAGIVMIRRSRSRPAPPPPAPAPPAPLSATS